MPSARKAASSTDDAGSAPAKKAAKATKAADAAPAKATKATRATKATKKKDAAAAAPEPAPSPFPPEFLESQRQLLIEERATHLRQAESLRAEADALVADVEPGDVQFDEESGEGDTISVERERDLALSASARAILEEIDRALAKLDNGTYGICEVSGTPIPQERLEAIPWARERVEYKTGGLGRR